MVDPIYRRAFEHAYGYNLNTTQMYETRHGQFEHDGNDLQWTGLGKLVGDIVQVSTYIPGVSTVVGGLGLSYIAARTLRRFIKTGKLFNDKEQKVFYIAYSSRLALSMVGGFLAAPADAALTYTRRRRVKQLCPKYYTSF